MLPTQACGHFHCHCQRGGATSSCAVVTPSKCCLYFKKRTFIIIIFPHCFPLQHRKAKHKTWLLTRGKQTAVNKRPTKAKCGQHNTVGLPVPCAEDRRCVLSHPCCPDNYRGRYQGGCRGTGVARKGSHLPSEGGPSSPSLRPVLIQTLLKMQLLRNAMFPGDTETSPTGRATGRHLGMGKTLQAWLGFRMPEPKG